MAIPFDRAERKTGRSTWEQAINAQTEYGLPGGTEQAWPIGQAAAMGPGDRQQSANDRNGPWRRLGSLCCDGESLGFGR